jgi:choline dehydrogenase
LKDRPDRVSVKDGVLVNRILFDGVRAIGVELLNSDGSTEQVHGHEIILCGGSINSPQLLMLSGIGDADHLKDMDIPVVAHVPGVGQNLQDHIEVYVVQKCKKPVTLLKDQKFPRMIKVGVQWFLNQTGACGTTHLESGGFTRSRPGVEHPDIMWHFLPSQVIDHGRKAPTLEAYQLHVGPMRPTSRGWLKLRSKDPRQHPVIQPNYLSTEIDRWEMRESIKLSRELFAQRAFDDYRDTELEPGPDAQTDEELDAFIREKADSSYHPSCTCRMGDSSSNDTVVEANGGKVVGTENLRVVDASVMPQVASGNLNAPTIMIAERMADLIRGKQVLPPANVPVYQPATLESRR